MNPRRGARLGAVVALAALAAWAASRASTALNDADQAPQVLVRDYGGEWVHGLGRPDANATATCAAPRSLLEEAECGAMFHDFYDGRDVERSGVRVAVFGHMYGEAMLVLRRIMGCPVNARPKNGPSNPGCVQDPSCVMYIAKSKAQVRDADVVILTKVDALQLTERGAWNDTLPRTTADGRRRFRVLYVREAESVPLEPQRHVDFVMGVQYWNAVLNPNFLVRPSTFRRLNERYRATLRDKPHLAMSVISNCEPTRSIRGQYINELVRELGADRVHQYGKCGDGHVAPSKPLHKMVDLVSQYKFYFAFENTVLDGYVTEKLFKTLSFSTVPVYLGAPDAPRVTRRKSFINVHDFGSPRELAEYLRYLEGNATAYAEYHAWRSDPPEEAFDPAYLELVSRHYPRLQAYNQVFETFKRATPTRKVNAARIASCCKLCNRRFLEHAAAEERHYMDHKPWPVSRIKARLFKGRRNPLA